MAEQDKASTMETQGRKTPGVKRGEGREPGDDRTRGPLHSFITFARSATKVDVEGIETPPPSTAQAVPGTAPDPTARSVPRDVAHGTGKKTPRRLEQAFSAVSACGVGAGSASEETSAQEAGTSKRSFQVFCQLCLESGRLPRGEGGSWPSARISVATYNSRKLARFEGDEATDEVHKLRWGIAERLLSADLVVVQELPGKVKALDRARRLCDSMSTVAATLVQAKQYEDPLLPFAAWQVKLGVAGRSNKGVWETYIKARKKQRASVGGSDSSLSTKGGKRRNGSKREHHLLIIRVPKKGSVRSEHPQPLIGLPLIDYQSKKANPFSFNDFDFPQPHCVPVPDLCWSPTTWVLLFSPDVSSFASACVGSAQHRIWQLAQKRALKKGRVFANTGERAGLHVRIALTSVHFPPSSNGEVQVQQLLTFFRSYAKYCSNHLEVSGPTTTKRKGRWSAADVLHIVLGDFNCCPWKGTDGDLLPKAVAAAGFRPTTSVDSFVDTNSSPTRQEFDHILVSQNAFDSGLLHSFASSPRHIDWSFFKRRSTPVCPGDHEPVVGAGLLQLRTLLPLRLQWVKGKE